MFDLLTKLNMKMNDGPLWIWGGFQLHNFADGDDDKGGGDGNGDDNKGDDNKGDDNKGDDKGDKGKDEPKTFEVKIGGESKLLTLDELKEHATKSAGADQLMREAAEMRKTAAGGAEVKVAFDKILKSDNVTTKDIEGLADLIGVNPKEMVAMFEEEMGKKDKGKDGKSKGTADKIGRDQLDDETKDILDQAKTAQIKEAEAEILKLCKEKVDKDEFFGKIIVDTPEEQRDDRKGVFLAMVHRDVRGKILASPYTGEKFGAEMIQNSIQTVRSELKKYGIPSKSSKQDAIGNILASLGPTGGLPVEVSSDKEVERVSSTEADYEDNVVKRLGQKMVKSLVERNK